MSVQSAAQFDLRRLAEKYHGMQVPFEAAEWQTFMVKMQIAQLAISYPEASVGVCAKDGTPLRFIGREDGLRVCCTGISEHCWRLSTVD